MKGSSFFEGEAVARAIWRARIVWGVIGLIVGIYIGVKSG